MWCWSSRLLVVAVLSWTGIAHAAFWQDTIDRAEWQQHAGQGRLLELAPVRELLSRFEESDGNRVTIRHPGGDAGTAWAVQLRDRLVAWGIPSDYVEMIPGSGGLDILHVSLVDGQ